MLRTKYIKCPISKKYWNHKMLAKKGTYETVPFFFINVIQYDQSKNPLRCLARLGWRSLRSAFASI